MVEDNDGNLVADRVLDAFKKIVPHLRGALWWSDNDVLKERQPEFNQADAHMGHPVLSLRKEEVRDKMDAVPMLVGTSGNSFSQHQRNCCIDVVGMTKGDPQRHTYFGSIVEPMMVSVSEMLAGVKPEKGEYGFTEKDRREVGRHDERARLWNVPRFKYRKLYPNWDKLIANESEMAMIDDYCLIHLL